MVPAGQVLFRQGEEWGRDQAQQRRAHRDTEAQLRPERRSWQERFRSAEDRIQPGVIEALMKVSKCPDFIVNRGHYFGAEGIEGEAPLTKTGKAALISYRKTF
jgi:hypothetical protein